MPGRLSTLFAVVLAAACARGDTRSSNTGLQAKTPSRQPIIDVHRHASWPGADDSSARAAALAEMDEHRIVLALLYINEPGDITDWLDAAPGRFVGGPAMPCPPTKAAPYYRCFAETEGLPDFKWLESGLKRRQIGVLGEMLFVYAGIEPNDSRMLPYWQLAARYDVPVAVHVNRGPPPTSSIRRNGACCPKFNGELGNPALLRPVLARHPSLRILLQHVGMGIAPDMPTFDEETFALLRDFPRVHVDLTILNSIAPEDAHEQELKRLVDSGFGDRVMFGTDGLAAGPILRRLEAISWLTADQRRAILYDNAARFLRLDPQTIANHHSSMNVPHPQGG